VLEEERKEVRQQILDRLQPGLVVEGQISNIVDFGAFVDLDGIDGLIHISELSWSHVNHPSEILTIGDTVKVKVLDIDRDRQRISLGLKQTQEDPWQRIVDTYNVGDELAGKVTKVVTFGAFVEILDGVEGLVHISELAPHHVESPREIVHPGDEIRVKILEIDSERRRLSLSAKRVEDQILPVSRPGEPMPEAGEEGEVEAGDGVEAIEASAALESVEPAPVDDVQAVGVAEVVAEPETAVEPEPEPEAVAPAEAATAESEPVTQPAVVAEPEPTADAEPVAENGESDGETLAAESAQQD
jgi:small subunit ribosomal protein S1